jgi:hypothetical protein
MAITLCCMLWSRPGKETALVVYEDKVLELLTDHDGTLLSRVRSDGADGRALEVQLLEFPSDVELDGYLGIRGARRFPSNATPQCLEPS